MGDFRDGGGSHGQIPVKQRHWENLQVNLFDRFSQKYRPDSSFITNGFLNQCEMGEENLFQEEPGANRLRQSMALSQSLVFPSRIFLPILR
jgi:hypothetical protein